MLNLLKSLTSTLLQIGLLLPLLLLIKRNYSKQQKRLLMLVAIIWMFDGLIGLGFYSTLFSSQQWNWAGRSASFIAAMMFVYYNPVLSKKDIGFTNLLKPFSFFPILLTGGLVLFFRLLPKAISGNFHSFHLETFAFQATLPGFSEEIIYRGIILGLLNKVYPSFITIFKAKIGWGVLIVSVIFGMMHGITLDKHWQILFSSQRFCMMIGFSFILSWLKQRSGNLLPAVIFHNLWNLIVFS